jgi:hypothetical protein
MVTLAKATFFFLIFVFICTLLRGITLNNLIDELTGSHIVQKFPAFYGNQRFATAFTTPRHLSLS